MLEIQKKYIDFLQEVINLIEPLNIDTSKYKKLMKRIKNTELIVPVIGGFSAGKSTFINSFLGDNILPTNITPETALATELRYANDNYIEAINKNNQTDRFELKDMDKIKQNASKYQYLKTYLNNNKLKEIEPLILVDMPGFDSPIEIHNKAIINYLGKGVYFAVLISVEDGNITKTILRELENILTLNKDFSVFLSKANLKTEEDIKEIKETIEEQLQDYFEIDKNVTPLYLNSGDELERMLKSINPEEIIRNLFKEELKYTYFDLEATINTKIFALKSSKQEIDNFLEDLQNGIENIISKKERMIKEVKEKYSDISVNMIIQKIEKELKINKEMLINLAMNNRKIFSREINEIIKNTLIFEVKNRLDEISEDIINDFKIELNNLDNVSGFEIKNEWIEIISSSLTHFVKNAYNGLNNWLVDKRKKTDNSMYKIITGTLAITTNILSPVVEAVIFLMPEIVSMLTENLQKRKIKAELNTKFDTEIIPTIKSKIRIELSKLLENQINNIIQIISYNFEKELKQKEEEIKATKKEKEENIKQIEAQIQKLQETKQTIENLTSKIIKE